MQLTDLSAHSFMENVVPTKLISISEEPTPVSTQKTSVAKDLILEQAGDNGYSFIADHVDLEGDVLLTVTNSLFNIDLLNRVQYSQIVNLENVNNIPNLNKFLRSANAKLPVGGLYISRAETSDIRKIRILNRLPQPLNWMHHKLDVVFTRILPKLRIAKGLYHFFTKSKVCALSRAEILGRLYYCGFEIIAEKYLDDHLYFAARKIGESYAGKDPHYGPIIRLKRVGKAGEIFTVYKLRTMHAYSEYLQQYVFERNQLQDGGKFKSDFRISPEGKFFRKFWLDELPMFVNLIKGDMKLVGIRPLSQHYFSLYTEELQKKRVMCKPGLIPPFYADMPKTLEEIMASEMRYLDAYAKSPLKTDLSYLFKAFNNILFKGARSK